MAKKAEVIITCDATTVKKVLEGINNEIEKTKKRRQELQEKQRTSIGLTKAEEKELQGLIKYENALNERIPKITGEMKKYGEVMKDLSGAKLKDLKKALQEGKAALNNMSARDPNRVKLVNDLQRIQKQIERNTGAIKSHGSAWQMAVKNITAYVGVFGAFNFIKNKITEVIRGGAELSDQMAKIRMVSGLAMEEIEDLTRSLAKLDTRTTLTELNELAYIGSKLGFGEMGVGALEEFAKAANQVNVALKEDLGNEAMTALSKITENMGLIKKMGVEQALLSTSSAMFKLFTSSTAAAGPIVEVTKRLAPMAQISGFATHEILALASASDALMQSEEVAGTAMSKFMMAMQNNHNVIEKTLGMTEGSIATMMKSGKSMEAFLTILDRMSGKNVTELQNVWKLLGSEGDRLIRVILAMANHTELVRQHLDTSSKAFKEATAVTEEYNIQQETAAAYLERANNKIRNAFINPDSSLAVKEMTKAWYDFVKSITDSDLALSSILTSINALLVAIRALIALLPGITFGLMAKGARMLYDNMKLANIATEGFITSWKKMDAATKSNWIGLIIGSLVQAVYWIKQFSSSTSDAEKEQKKLNDAIENMHEKADVEIKSLDRLKKQLDDTNISQEERNALLSKVRKDYDIYLNYLGIEKNKVVDLTKHYDALTKVMRQRFAYQEREDYKRDVMGGEDGIRMQRRKASASLKKQATDMGIKELDVDTEVMPLLRQGWSVDQVMNVIAPDLKRAADNISKSESAARTFAGPGAAIGKRSNQNQKYLDLKSSFQKFADAVQREQKMEADIDAAFASEIGDFDYDKWLRTQVMGEFKVEPPKGPKGDKGGSELKNKFKTAKEQAEGLIAKIDQWYNLQDATINDFAASGKITEDEADKALKAMKMARNIALEKARLAVASGNDEDWKQFYTNQMSRMMVDHGEWSGMLFEEITKVDINALHDFLATFDGSDGMKRLDASSFFDTMRKKAAESKKVVSETQAKAAEELNKLLLKYDYFQQASLQFAKNLTQIGALGTTAEQMAKGMEGVPDAKQTQEAAQSMLAAVIRQGSSIYAVNPSDAKGVADMLRQATTDAMTEADYLAGKTGGEQAKWFDLFPEVKDWMDNPEQHKKELEQLFNVMLIAEQDYYSKRKQSYQTAKREQENRFRAAGFTDQEEQEQTALSNLAKQKDAGINATFMEQQGLGSIANDPEVMAIQNRIYWRNEEVKAAEARLQALKAQQDQEIENAQAASATLAELDRIRSEQAAERMGLEDLLKEKQSALFDQELNLSTKVAQELQKRVQTINSLTKPITDFTQAAGRKIGDMIFNMESEEATWEQLWKNMALAVGESVIQMGAQYAQNLIMQQAMNHASEAEAVADAGVKVTAGIAAGSAKTIGELGWWGIPLIGVISALLMGLLQSALSTKSSKDGSSSSSSTAATPKTKLVSGMLTYDRGNVDKFAGRRKLYDDGETQVYGRRRYLGEDGKVYTATAEPAPKDGLVTHPIATTVQGQPALVAENGPEIVIGRETTKAIMMNEPELIRYLANYQQQGARRLYDGGNVTSPVLGGSAADNPVAGLSPDDARALTAAIGTFNQTVQQMQQKGIPCYINKFGKGGLIDEVQSGMKFVNQYKG